MEALIELIQSIPSKDFPVIDRSFMSSEEDYAFYQALESGLIREEKVAIDSYFKGKPNAKKYYNRLSKRLYDKLAKCFIVSERRGANNTQKAYFEIYRDYFIANELSARGKQKAFLKLGERTINKGLKFELWEIVSALCRKMTILYSTTNPNPIKYKFFKEILEKATNHRNAEETIEGIFTDLVLLISTNRNSGIKQLTAFENNLDKVISIFDTYSTEKIGYYFYTIQTIYTELKNDIWSTLHYCKEALTFFDKSPISTPVGNQFMFLHKSVNVQIRLKQYDQAQETLDNAFGILAKHGPNWHIAKNYEATLAFHQGDYLKADAVIKEALGNKKELSPIMLEQWRIMEAYAYLLLPDKRKPFKLGKFMNEVPIFSKDKRGHHTNILILQTLFLLKKKKYQAIISRVEALRQYTSQHLRKDDTFRTNCFIKMLHLLPAANFHPINVNRRTSKYYKRMTSLPSGKQRMDIDVEVVPYEDLWKKVLEMMG